MASKLLVPGRPAPWLLVSDIHFQQRDLSRIQKTAQWITDLARQRNIQRAVICGDLLTDRNKQPIQILAACSRFIRDLSDAVPRVHIVLGNHDLAYRNDYYTTALDPLRMSRLAPYVSLHSNVSTEVWDGRRVLLLPFREDQLELTEAVESLGASGKAHDTVAFAHLAIHKAVTQRHVPGSPYPHTYNGLTSPGSFAPLARTFTGHFHCHQVIQQPRDDVGETGQGRTDPLQGAIIYLGSPLQLSWGDLHDEQKGVVLFDPDTLRHELVLSPHAVGYTAKDAKHVLRGEINGEDVVGKHVKLVNIDTHVEYVTARDRLLRLGAKSVHNWNPMRPERKAVAFGSPETRLPAGDFQNPDPEDAAADPQDLVQEARSYVEALELKGSLLQQRETLITIGQRLLGASEQGANGNMSCKALFAPEPLEGTKDLAVSATAHAPTQVFNASPRSLSITNFLSVQGTLDLEFGRDIPPGLTFVVGDNGAGKSMLLEAITWCQFGKCIRQDQSMSVKDVVNDAVGKNCCVRLAFDNGYAITRYRGDKVHGNRVIVERDGVVQSQLEHADMRATQRAIDALLGINYDMFVRTVVLGQEGVVSFMSTGAAQRRELIEPMLGLEPLNGFGDVSRKLLRELDGEIGSIRGKLGELARLMQHTQAHLKEHTALREGFLQELDQTRARLQEAARTLGEEDPEKGLAVLESRIMAANQRVADLQHLARKSAELCALFHDEKFSLSRDIHTEEQRLGRLHSFLAFVRNQQDEAAAAELEREHGPAPEPGWRQSVASFVVDALGGVRRWLGADACGTSHVDFFVQNEVGGPPASWTATYFVRPYRRVVASVCRGLKALETFTSETRSEKKRPLVQQSRRSRPEDYEARVCELQRDIDAAEQGIAALQARARSEALIRTLAARHSVDVQTVRSAAASSHPEDARRVHQTALTTTLREQAQMRRQAEEHRSRARRCEQAQQQLDMYAGLVAREQKELGGWKLQCEALEAQVAALEADRELLDFWASGVKTRRPSASGQPAKKKKSKESKGDATTTPHTFRAFLLEKNLAQLNTLVAEALTVLYHDTRHAQATASGMMRPLYTADEAGGARTLDSSLALHPDVGYAKRSGGERKRMDLALFFALLQLSQARSRYRAHYLLVDEVFDSLDDAGMAAVVRWCQFLQPRVPYVAVITHRQQYREARLHSLQEGGGGGDEDDDDGTPKVVVTARMGQKGTELEMDGRPLGQRTFAEEASRRIIGDQN